MTSLVKLYSFLMQNLHKKVYITFKIYEVIQNDNIKYNEKINIDICAWVS